MQKQKPGALTGVNVLDLSRLLPGPYCSMILADHGARVISIESRQFIADGLFFNTVNRNKEHMTLNLKTDEGKNIFFQLIEKADVILEGFRLGVVKRLGVDYESVHKANPKIVYCSISGYGQTGGFVDRVGHDVNYLSYAGILELIGEADQVDEDVRQFLTDLLELPGLQFVALLLRQPLEVLGQLGGLDLGLFQAGAKLVAFGLQRAPGVVELADLGLGLL